MNRNRVTELVQGPFDWVARTVSGFGDWRKGKARGANLMIETAAEGRGVGEHCGQPVNGLSLRVQKVHFDPCFAWLATDFRRKGSFVLLRLAVAGEW